MEAFDFTYAFFSDEPAPRPGGGRVQPARAGRPGRLRPHQPDPRRQLAKGMALPPGICSWLHLTYLTE